MKRKNREKETERKRKMETLLQLLFVLCVRNTEKLSCISQVAQCEVYITKHCLILCRFLNVKLTGFKCVHYREHLMHCRPLNELSQWGEVPICHTLKCKNCFYLSCCCLEGQSGIPKNGLGGCGEAVIGSASQQYTGVGKVGLQL